MSEKPEGIVYPPQLAKAMADVMSEIPKIKFDKVNTFVGYAYSSVDAIFAAVRPIMAKHGVSLHMTELEYNMIAGEKSAFLQVDYEAFFVHEGGCSPVIKQRAMVKASMGSQAYGAAQSYAEKFILRRAFLLETGEGDTDDTEHSKPDNKEKTEVKKPRPLPTGVAKVKSDILKSFKAMGLTKDQMRDLTLSITGRDSWADVNKAGADSLYTLCESATMDQILAIIEEQQQDKETA